LLEGLPSLLIFRFDQMRGNLNLETRSLAVLVEPDAARHVAIENGHGLFDVTRPRTPGWFYRFNHFVSPLFIVGHPRSGGLKPRQESD
jgi:hypothetical protein